MTVREPVLTSTVTAIPGVKLIGCRLFASGCEKRDSVAPTQQLFDRSHSGAECGLDTVAVRGRVRPDRQMGSYHCISSSNSPMEEVTRLK